MLSLAGQDFLTLKIFPLEGRSWYPLRSFLFCHHQSGLVYFLRTEIFLSLIKQRPEPSSDGSLRDMWDGRSLRQFFKDTRGDNTPLLEDKNNLALLLYLDFFNPFTRAVHSSGVLCMTVLNLPRSVRYQKKWAMLTNWYHSRSRGGTGTY